MHNADQNSEVDMELKFVDLDKGEIIEGKVYIGGVFSKPGHTKIKFRTDSLVTYFIPVGRILKMTTTDQTITDLDLISSFFANNYKQRCLIEAEEELKNCNFAEFVSKRPNYDFHLKKTLIIGKTKGLKNSDLEETISRKGGILTTNLNNTVEVAILVYETELPKGKKMDLLREFKMKGSHIEIIEADPSWFSKVS